MPCFVMFHHLNSKEYAEEKISGNALCNPLCCIRIWLKAEQIASCIISGNRYFLSVSERASGYFLFSPQGYRSTGGNRVPLLNPAGMTG